MHLRYLHLVSRVPEGEKIRKEDEREREAKFDEYNRPKDQKQ